MGTPQTIYDTIRNDSTFKTLTGATASDKRIYREWPISEVTVSSTYPAYVILSRESSTPIGDSAYGDDELWQARIVARDPDTRDNVAQRVKDLIVGFHTPKTATVTGRFHAGGGYPSSGPDGFDEEVNAFVVNVRFTLETIQNTY